MERLNFRIIDLQFQCEHQTQCYYFLILYVGSFEAYISIDRKNGAYEEAVDKKLYAVHYRHIEVIYLVKAYLHLHVKYMYVGA